MGKAVPKRSEGRYDVGMRSRAFLFALLLIAGSLALPLGAHAAAIPFFGPIVPSECAAGFGMLIAVINNIIRVLLSFAIVFVGPLMIAYSGFLFVVNPVNASGKEQAKKILTNAIVGIVISLSAWMIVGAIMAVLYSEKAWGTWEALMTSGGAGECIVQEGSTAGPSNPVVTTGPGVTVVPPKCSFSEPPKIVDAAAKKMEDMKGHAVIWTNTDPRLKKCVDKFGKGTVTSAYRPRAYQDHLYQISSLWCTQGLKRDTTAACSSLKHTVYNDLFMHFGSKWDCGAVAAGGSSNHEKGYGAGSIAVDIAGLTDSEKGAAKASCLDWKPYIKDEVHFELMGGCTCS